MSSLATSFAPAARFVVRPSEGFPTSFLARWSRSVGRQEPDDDGRGRRSPRLPLGRPRARRPQFPVRSRLAESSDPGSTRPSRSASGRPPNAAAPGAAWREARDAHDRARNTCPRRGTASPPAPRPPRRRSSGARHRPARDRDLSAATTTDARAPRHRTRRTPARSTRERRSRQLRAGSRAPARRIGTGDDPRAT